MAKAPDFSHMSNADLVEMLQQTVTSNDPSDVEFNRHITNEIKKRKPSPSSDAGGESLRFAQLVSENARMRVFIENIRDNFDCDHDGHRYSTYCRCCDAKELLDSLPPAPQVKS